MSKNLSAKPSPDPVFPGHLPPDAPPSVPPQLVVTRDVKSAGPVASARSRHVTRVIDSIKTFAIGSRKDDGLSSFEPERSRLTRSRRPLLIALAVVGLAGVPFLVRGRMAARASAAAAQVQTGRAQFTSAPAGAEVLVDGTRRGVTPLSLSLPIGAHAVEIRRGSTTRTTAVKIETGTLVSHDVDLRGADPVPPATGGLEIGSEPQGTAVSIDGSPRGTTPLKVRDLAPGVHVVEVGRGEAAVKRSVTVTGGVISSVFVATTGESSGGWISAKSPIALEIHEHGRLLGVTSADRLMLPVGRHDLVFVNSGLEFEADKTVQIASGKTTAIAIDVPNGSLSVNALPWAEVSVDGRAVGTTPIANLAVPIGSHEIVWKHPTLGEVRRTVTVTAKSPVRVGVELKR